jgi:hypothetical protein
VRIIVFAVRRKARDSGSVTSPEDWNGMYNRAKLVCPLHHCMHIASSSLPLWSFLFPIITREGLDRDCKDSALFLFFFVRVVLKSSHIITRSRA